MQVQAETGFDEMLKIVKTLPSGKLRRLKAAIEKELPHDKPASRLKKILLNGPVASKKTLMQIEKNRKAINQWRMN